MRRTIAAFWLFGGVWSCFQDPPPKPAPAHAESTPVANPLLAAGEPTAAEREFAGVVTDRLYVGGYAYVAVDRDDGRPSWVATMGRGADVGSRVRVEAFAAADDFHSRRLDRRFARILFGVVQ